MKRSLLFVLLLGMIGLHPIVLAQLLFTASLDGSHEVPPVTSTGQATVWAVLSADMTSLTYQVTYAHLDTTFTAGHFHSGVPGVAGPVVHPFSFVGNTTSGTWTNLPDSIVRQLFQGNIYANVHSKLHPGGEIRGQLTLVQGVGFTVSLNGSQETPPAATSATGTGWVVLDSAAARLRYHLTIAGLSANLTGSHFHVGALGVGGPVVKPIAFVDSTSDGAWSGFPDSILTNLVKGNLYLNAHSSNYPGGEIRGQITRVGKIVFSASLDGTQETPPTVTSAQATAWAVLSADMTSLSYEVTYAHLDTTFTAGHFHSGVPGVAGPVVHPFSFVGNTTSGTWTSLPDSIVRRLLQGNIYANVHSKRYPGGEVRGQLTMTQGVGYTVSLNGAQETPPAATSATGTGWVVLDSASARLRYRLTIAGLSANLTGSHFHVGAPGIGGPVVKPIAFVDSTSNGAWSGFPDSILTELVKGNLYLNAHSSNYPGGEIRGQVLYAQGLSTLSVKEIPNRLPSSFALEQNYPNPFNPSTTMQFEVLRASHVSLKVFNLLGQEVATLLDETRPAGTYSVTFNADRLASGIYFYRLSSDAGFSETRKMVLLK